MSLKQTELTCVAHLWLCNACFLASCKQHPTSNLFLGIDTEFFCPYCALQRVQTYQQEFLWTVSAFHHSGKQSGREKLAGYTKGSGCNIMGAEQQEQQRDKNIKVVKYYKKSVQIRKIISITFMSKSCYRRVINTGPRM